MTVGAQQDALGDLLAQTRERPCQAAPADPEALLRRIDVVEVQGRRHPGEPAEDARPTGLVKQRLLRASPPLTHRVRPAPDARPRPVPADHMGRLTVPNARGRGALERRWAGPSSRGPGRPEAMAPQPVLHRRRASIHRHGDLTNGHVPGDQFGEQGLVESAARGMTLGIRGGQPVTTQPILHGGWCTPDAPTDLRARQPLVQEVDEYTLLHHTNTSSHDGRKPPRLRTDRARPPRPSRTRPWPGRAPG